MRDPDLPKGYATLKEVAAYLREHPDTTVIRCRRGEFKGARKTGYAKSSRWRIPWRSVQALVDSWPDGQ